MEQSPPWETQEALSESRNSPNVMEPEGSLPHSQTPVTCPCRSRSIQIMLHHPTSWISIYYYPYIWYLILRMWSRADSGGRAFSGVGLKPLDCWNRVFESCWWHGCSSSVFVVLCVGSELYDVLITGSEEFYQLCVLVCSLETSTARLLKVT
jgi:hypothetical protein